MTRTGTRNETPFPLFRGGFIFVAIRAKCNSTKLRIQRRFISSTIGSISYRLELQGVTYIIGRLISTRAGEFTLFGGWSGVGTANVAYTNQCNSTDIGKQ